VPGTAFPQRIRCQHADSEYVAESVMEDWSLFVIYACYHHAQLTNKNPTPYTKLPNTSFVLQQIITEVTLASEIKKQQLRDIKGYVKGTKESIAVIENIKPRMQSGVHKAIDEQFKDTERFKQSEEGNFEE